MKKLLTVLTLFVMSLSFAAVTAKLSSQPGRPVENEPFMLQLTVDSTDEYTLKMPEIKGLEIDRSFTSRQVQQNYVNGVLTVQVTSGMRAVADRAGIMEIPPFELNFNGKTVKTNSLRLNIRDAASLPQGERITAVLNILPDRQVYAGETLRANVELFIPAPYQLRDISGISVKDLSDAVFFPSGRNNSKFFLDSSGTKRQNGSIFEIGAIFQVRKSGTFEPSFDLQLQVSRESMTRGFFESAFFGSPVETKSAVAKMQRSLKVLPLPPIPAGCVDTGLNGNWNIAGKISKNSFQAGDLAEISVTFTGEAPGIMVEAPVITIPDARCYPAEVSSSRDKKQFTVKYPFVSLQAAEKKINVKFAVFDPSAGKYRITEIPFVYTVVPNKALKNVPVQQIRAGADVSAEKEPPVPPADMVPFYIVEPDRSVRVPLINNVAWISAVIIFLGFAVCAVSFIRLKRNYENMQSKRNSELVKAVKNSSDIMQTLKDAGAASVAQALGMENGTTFSAVADQCDDPQLREFFNALESSAFAPDGGGSCNQDGLKEKLVKFLKNSSIVILCFCGMGLWGASFDEGKKAFDKGEFLKSAEIFGKEAEDISKSVVYPAMIYNCGCSKLAAGESALAYVMFKRASLLDPRNQLYRTAAAEAAEQLPALKENGTAEINMLLRPDEFIFCGIIFLALSGIVISMRKKISRVWLIVIELLLLCAAAGLFAAAFYQSRNEYSPERVIVTDRKAELCSLPSSDIGRKSGISDGTPAVITNENGDYFLINTGKSSGWIKKTQVKRIFPYGIKK